MSRDRGQTTLDYAIGAGVFLVTVAFVVAFIPSMIQPFDQSAQEELVASDRVATQLSKGTLGDPADPYVLSPRCVANFFRETPRTTLSCRFDQTTDLTVAGTTLADRVSVSERVHLNVHMVDSGGNLLCWDDDTQRVVSEGDPECDDTNDDPVFEVGQQVPSGSTSVVVSRRFVSLEDRGVSLQVRAW
ncbi:DUF7287 family protein [Halogranum rubrum]|nr:hypothetical protein [Halogranum salarium]